MQYVNPSFSIPPADKLDGLGCPRCALGPKWGEHSKECRACGVCDREHPHKWDHCRPPCQAHGCMNAAVALLARFCAEHNW
jgi:hypothetical protein